MGEEDIKPHLLFSEDDQYYVKSNYSSTLRCISPTGQVLVILVDNYVQLKNYEGSIKILNSQSDRKINRQQANDLIIKSNDGNDLNNPFNKKPDRFYSKLYRRQITNPHKAIVEEQLRRKDESSMLKWIKYNEKQNQKLELEQDKMMA